MELEMTIDTNLSELVINKLTKEQYASAEKEANALYMITDEEFVQSVNGVSPVNGDLTVKTINGQSILGSGDIVIESGESTTIHEVHGVASGSITELPLGMALENTNQVISVNLGNTLILPNLWSLNASRTSIVLSNAIEDGTMWSVVFVMSISVEHLPIATNETVGVVKVGNNLSIDGNGALSANLSGYATTTDLANKIQVVSTLPATQETGVLYIIPE